ncbi:MAG: hypothetical protein ACLSDJ_01915 [Butyricimonas faecihominis]
MASRHWVLSTPSVAGLEQIADKGYKVTPMFKTDSTGVWNELETTDFVDDVVRLNPEVGEQEKQYATVVALSRKQNGKEQKIILTEMQIVSVTENSDEEYLEHRHLITP